MLGSMGSQRVGHLRATEQQQIGPALQNLGNEGWQHWPRGLGRLSRPGPRCWRGNSRHTRQGRTEGQPQGVVVVEPSVPEQSQGTCRTPDKRPGLRDGKIPCNHRQGQAQMTLVALLNVNLVHSGLGLAHYRPAPHQLVLLNLVLFPAPKGLCAACPFQVHPGTDGRGARLV